MKRALFLILLLLGMASIELRASETQELFSKSNAAYKNRDYAQALSGYEALAKKIDHADLYYNLANAAFKEGQLGKAILYYERAKKLSPRDTDIRKNLSYAKGLIEYRVEDKQSWYLKQFSKMLEFVRLQECLMALMVAYSLLLLVVIAGMFLNSEFLKLKMNRTLIAMLIVLSCVTSAKFYEARIHQKAIVLTNKLDVRYGPSKDEKLAFNLVEGIEVSIDDTLNDWVRISLVNGESGWILKDGIEKI